MWQLVPTQVPESFTGTTRFQNRTQSFGWEPLAAEGDFVRKLKVTIEGALIPVTGHKKAQIVNRVEKKIQKNGNLFANHRLI